MDQSSNFGYEYNKFAQGSNLGGEIILRDNLSRCKRTFQEDQAVFWGNAEVLVKFLLLGHLSESALPAVFVFIIN